MILASSPILGTPTLSTGGKNMGLGSPSLLARKWTHVAIKYLIKLIKDRIESYDNTIFK